MGRRGKNRGDEEMDDSSIHSVQSVSSSMSTNTSASMQDVELAEAAMNPQDGTNSARKLESRMLKYRCLKAMQEAKERFVSSEFHGLNPAVLCILATEAAERFAYYGFRASLVLYFTQELRMDDTTAISLFAFASYVANFTPICGAVLGDGKLGRFQTIVAFGFVVSIFLSTGLVLETF